MDSHFTLADLNNDEYNTRHKSSSGFNMVINEIDVGDSLEIFNSHFASLQSNRQQNLLKDTLITTLKERIDVLEKEREINFRILNQNDSKLHLFKIAKTELEEYKMSDEILNMEMNSLNIR